MKRILIIASVFSLLITANQLQAQEKVKSKDDKTKIKDDNYKEKDKNDKTKIKDDNYKEKDKNDKTKIKDDNYKEKDKDNKIKIKDENGKIKIKNPDMNMAAPYTAGYSSNYVIGEPAYSSMVLDVWKDWDDNAFDRHDYMADSLVMYLPDGSVVKGKAANLEGAKKYRGGMTSAKSTIQSWVPLKSVDKNENWVAIWGSETDTWADGKTSTRDIHEIWRINKEGKIDMMRQYTAVPSPQ